MLSGDTYWTTRAIPRLDIPSVKMTDGPHGLREETTGGGTLSILNKSVPATCFPTLVVYASSWDRELVYKCSHSIGEQAASRGIVTVLGPSINIKRSPLCGRNFEYFSEDPYLSSEMAIAFAEGVESNNVGCCLKHYCANNCESNRILVDSIVDERTMREIYLPSFERTIKRVKPMMVMSSYNRIEGEYTSESKKYLTDILRDEWGFKGLMVSDWGAVNDRVKSIQAGLDLEMPGNNQMNSGNIIDAYNNGTLSMEDIDKAVTHILEYVKKGYESKSTPYQYDYTKSHEIAREMAAAGSVLLKNDDNILPFKKDDKIAVIGELARTSRYQGGGSSHMVPIKLVSILDALESENINYEFTPGYKLKGDGYNEKLIKKAKVLAKTNDKVMVVIGLTPEYESEGFDREHMKLPEGQNKLVEELLKVNPNICIVLVCGSAVEMPWVDKAKAILNIYVGGEASGEGAVDVMFGNVTPSGKLAETFPVKPEDNINNQYFPMGSKNVQYRESIYVGYRYYDSAKKEVNFPFGHGLSYTTFKYSNLKLSCNEIKDTDELILTYDITNTGKVAGAEVSQVYVKDVESTIFRPEKELKGFDKTFLNPGETKTVTIKLNKRSFAFYNVLVKNWTVESGDFEILVGASSRDIRLSDTVKINAPKVEIKDYRKTASVYYNMDKATDIPVEQFANLYGKEVPKNVPPKKGEFDINNTLDEARIVPIGRIARWVAVTIANIASHGSENHAMAVKCVTMFPYRFFCGLTGNFLTIETVRGCVDMLNGKKGGFRRALKGFFIKYRPKK